VLRSADDGVVGFEAVGTARAFPAALRERLAKFGLTPYPDKTRWIKFGRDAAERRRSSASSGSRLVAERTDTASSRSSG